MWIFNKEKKIAEFKEIQTPQNYEYEQTDIFS